MYYDRESKPITQKSWIKRFDSLSYKVVKKTTVWRDLYSMAEVSTVWLGLDHGYGGGPPIIFETMVFGNVSMD